MTKPPPRTSRCQRASNESGARPRSIRIQSDIHVTRCISASEFAKLSRTATRHGVSAQINLREIFMPTAGIYIYIHALSPLVSKLFCKQRTSPIRVRISALIICGSNQRRIGRTHPTLQTTRRARKIQLADFRVALSDTDKNGN